MQAHAPPISIAIYSASCFSVGDLRVEKIIDEKGTVFRIKMKMVVLLCGINNYT